MEIKERFLNYVSFDTQSDSYSHTVPSTSKQLKLGNYLVEELKSLGIENAKIDEFGVVYGTIPSNNNHQGDVIGFIAHMDTSPDASGKDIHPQIIKDYQGQKIILNEDKELYLDPEQYPQLLQLIHHDLITTDGTTLLGADDKAGIAIIMQMVEYIYNHPEFKHNDIQIAFTPDEEIGHGSDHFNVDYFNAQYAYTIDGGDIHIVEYENFNAFSAEVKVHGRSIHPGSAKNKMINSTRVAYEFDSLLPVHMRPESTEGYEGFNHLHSIQGTCEETVAEYIIRNHDLQQANKQCQDFKDIAKFLNKKYGYKDECWISKQFKNVWCASPLYDWKANDIWHANYLFSYDYNKLYDLYYKAGLTVSQMRVASPFNDYSKDALNLYRVIDTEIWCRLVGRVQGANFAAIYGRTKAMGYRSIALPQGHTWKSYTQFLLDTLPKRLRNNYIRKFNTSIHFWHETGGGLDEKTIRELEQNGYRIKRNGVSNYTLDKKSRIIFLGPIPDDTDNIKSTKDIPSWKRMCYCILKNDHICRFMGFGLTRQQQKRLDLIKKKYESIEDFNYGLSESRV